MRNQKKENLSLDGKLMQDIVTDPFGMYTGIPDDPEERPIQDADDL